MAREIMELRGIECHRKRRALEKNKDRANRCMGRGLKNSLLKDRLIPSALEDSKKEEVVRALFSQAFCVEWATVGEEVGIELSTRRRWSRRYKLLKTNR